MYEDDYETEARFWQADKPNTIVIAPEDYEEAVEKGTEYGDVIEVTYRYFVDNAGFSTESLNVTQNKEQAALLQTQVEFLDDGIVMAKLQGFID